MTVDERLRRCFGVVFPDLTDVEIERADMQHLGAWNSFALLQLLARIEREFDVRLSPDQINQFTSYARILDTLSSLAAGEPADPSVEAWR